MSLHSVCGRILTPLLFIGVVLVDNAPASAQEDADASADNFTAKNRLMGNSGIGSVVGLMGGTYTYAPFPSLQFELGSGIGWSGFQFSVMPKLSVGEERHRFVIGIGPSLAAHPDNNPPHTYVALWLNAEVGYEYRSAGGFSFLFAGGVFRGLAGEVRDQCFIDCDGDTRGWSRPVPKNIFPQGRIAFGRWF